MPFRASRNSIVGKALVVGYIISAHGQVPANLSAAGASTSIATPNIECNLSASTNSVGGKNSGRDLQRTHYGFPVNATHVSVLASLEAQTRTKAPYAHPVPMPPRSSLESYQRISLLPPPTHSAVHSLGRGRSPGMDLSGRLDTNSLTGSVGTSIQSRSLDFGSTASSMNEPLRRRSDKTGKKADKGARLARLSHTIARPTRK